MSQTIDRKIHEFIEKSRGLTGQIIQEREPWNTEVTAQAIRHFAYGISDDNPLWLDPDYARKSDYGRLVAPPTFLTSVLYPALHGYLMKLPMSNLIGELEYEWFHPILEGDSLRASAKQTGVYESKNRENRSLVCILSETSYWNQKEELVGKAKSNLVWIARTENDFLVNRSIYEYSEEELAEMREALDRESRRGDRLLWGEDVEINAKLPPLVRGPLTVGDLICWQAATGPPYRPGALGYRDTLKAPHASVKNPITGWPVKYSQQHEDFLLAKQRGMSAPFDNGVMRFAWLAPLLTNWMGDRGQLKRLSVQMNAPVLYGDTIWYEGTVVKKTERDSGILVKIKITGTNQLGELTTTGEGEVLLPSRINEPQECPLEIFVPNSYTEEPCFHQLIEGQVERRPEAIALVDNCRQLTYRELNRQANQLAHYLKQFHLEPNTLIGICLDRSCEFAIAILAILKAGSAYLPLDSEYPSERLAFMLKDAKVPILVTRKELGKIVPESDLIFVYLDSKQSEIAGQSLENPADEVSSNNLAYAIYTSGSTGQPKAVCIPHYSLSSYMRSIGFPLGIEESDKYLHTASFSFSAGVRQTLLPLFIGATLVIADRQQRQDPVQLFQLIKNTEVTHWDTGPTIWPFCINFLQELDEKARLDLLNNSLRLILVTGEPLAWNTPHDWRYQLQHNARIINLYSQSETTGTVSYYLIPEEFNQETGIVPLGKPLQDVTILLLDENLNPVPEGEIGELCVAGKRQVRSYLNRPELTRKKFIINPFEGITHLYKTGDLARYSPEGILEFVGRSDRRIKIRGLRVELEGIEVTLNRHPDVKETVVIARNDFLKANNLVAYVALKNYSLILEKPSVIKEELRNFVAEKLPEHAVPSLFIFLDSLPRNSNGKLERRNLPSPELLRPQKSNYVSPRDELELELTKIWESVLETQPIGIQDNFFALGGHSILAVRLFAKIEKIFNRNLPLSILFDAPTIEQLANLLRQQGWSASWSSFYHTIKLINRDNDIPLSFAQERLWFLDKLEQKSATYNIFRAWRLFGNLSIQSLEQALQEIVRRHKSLRTIFKAKNGVPIQIISPTIATPLNIIDVQQLPEIEQEKQVINFVKQEAQKPFDLESGPLLRGNLLQLDSGSFILTLTIHHIISDGWSMGVLLGELSTLYQAFNKGEKSPLAELPIQYADYGIWEREWLKEQQQQSQLNYWKQKLANAPPLLELPTDRPRPSVQTFRGGTESFQLSRELTQKLHALSQQSGCTLFMTLLAAWSSLLYRYSQQSDILVGTPIANRQHQEIEPLIGFFANTLVMRTQFEEGQSFANVLKGVRQTAIEAYSHQDTSFEQLVMELEPSRSLSYNPLFQVMFVLQNADMGNLELPEVSCSQLERSSVVAKFDLTLSMQETEDGLMGYWKYNRDLFEGATIGRWMGHFQVLLESIVANPQQEVEQLPLLPENEGHKILVQWNDTTTDYPQDKCIHQLFEEQAECTPDAVAVIFENDQLTYRELNAKANQLAHYLQSLGVEPEVLVGICVERSIEMIIGFLAILKAGGAYVPIDPNYPSDRLAYILEDSKARVLLTQENLVTRFSGYKTQVVCFEKNWDTFSGENNIQNGQVNSANLAYVIYTSGSTGKPKAVTIEHRAALNLSVGLQHAIYAIPLPRQRRVSVNAPLIFDASVQQLIRLLHGDTLYIIPKTIRLNGDALLSYLQKQQIDVFDCTPSQLTLIVEKWFSREETLPEIVLVGGEAIDELIWQALVKAKYTRFYNVYGPTECTVDTTVASCYHNSVKPVIGHPIANTQTYILDNHLQPVPIGVTGELHIGGAGLARGYLNRPELTEQKFIPNPFSNEPGSRLYKTGDLAHYLPDGNIEYIGRIDNQVKIRGFRIELGEIEAVLTQHPNIGQAVVIVREDIPRDKRLAAYIVAKGEVVSSDLRGFLKSKLPNYMMPSAFVFLDAIPLTPNGKIDRRAFPVPDVSTQEAEKIAPRTTRELQLVQIWSEVLNIPSVGVRDNFFDKGGHSLLAVRLVARIEEQFGTRLPLATLFNEPTIEGQASLLSAAVNPELFSPLVPIQPKGSLPPFFCIHPVGGNVLCYWDLAHQLAVEQPFYGLQAVGLNGESKPKTCIEDMATIYIEAIQTVQPQGPYQLGGWSFGGIVAFEIARQLEALGTEVETLALIDSFNSTVLNKSKPDETMLVISFAKSLSRPFGKELPASAEKMGQLELEEKLNYILNEGKKLQILPPEIGLKQMQQLFAVFQTNVEAMHGYVPQPYLGQITLFYADGKSEELAQKQIQGWRSLAASGINIHKIAGDHFSIIRSEALAKELGPYLKF